MTRIRTYNEVDHATGSRLLEQVVEQGERLRERLSRVRAVVGVASGKGGVGKSTVTAGVARSLARMGRSVGVVDADLNGPSLPRLLEVDGSSLGDGPDGVIPATGRGGVKVISMALLQNDPHAPVRWREPGGHASLWQSSLELSALREFLGDVAWGELDTLLVDVPPGTDKIHRLLELVPWIHGVLVVTTPGDVALSVVSRSLAQVREAGVPTVGLISNMTGYRCPGCGETHPLFPGGEPELLARRFDLPIWAELPFDPKAVVGLPGGEDPFGPLATRFDAEFLHREEGS